MYSKKTTNYELPKWVPTDHPDFLTDMNDAFEKIDTGMNANKVDGAKLREDVDALAIRMTDAETEVAAMKEKVDALVTLEENPVFVTLKEKVEEIETGLGLANEAIAQGANDIGSLQVTMANVQKKIKDIDDTLALHATELEDHHNAIESINQNNATLREKVGEVATKLEVLEDQIDKNTEDIAVLKPQVAESKGNITTLTNRYAQLNTEQGIQRGEINVLKTSGAGSTVELGNVKTSVADNTSKIAALETRVTTIETQGGGSGTENPDISGLATRLDAVEAKNTVQDNKISNLEVADVTLTTKVGNVEQSVTAVGGRIDTLQGEVDANEGRIADVETLLEPVTSGNFSFSDVKTKLTAVETTLGTLGEGATGTVADLTALTGRVSTVETTLNAKSTIVDKLNTNVFDIMDVTNEYPQVSIIGRIRNLITFYDNLRQQIENPIASGIKFNDGKIYLWNGTEWNVWNVNTSILPTPSEGTLQIAEQDGELSKGVGIYSGQNGTLVQYASDNYAPANPVATGFCNGTGSFYYVIGGGAGYDGYHFYSPKINIRGMKELHARYKTYVVGQNSPSISVSCHAIATAAPSETRDITPRTISEFALNNGSNTKIPIDFISDWIKIRYTLTTTPNVTNPGHLVNAPYGLYSLVGIYGERS